MKKLLIATAMVLSISCANAMTKLDNIAQDIACNWNDSHGVKKTDICHIVSRGIIQGETTQVISIGRGTYDYVIKFESATAVIMNGDKPMWTGTVLMNSFALDKNQTNVQTIKLSNGMTIKLYHSDVDE